MSPQMRKPDASAWLLPPLCAARGWRRVGDSTLLVPGLWADPFGFSGGVFALSTVGGAARTGFSRCAGGDRFRSRSAAWRARSRMSATGLDSFPDQSLYTKRSLWSVDRERDFRSGAFVATDAPDQRNTGRHFGIPGSNTQHLAFGGLPVPAFAGAKWLIGSAGVSGAGRGQPSHTTVCLVSGPAARTVAAYEHTTLVGAGAGGSFGPF